MVESVVDVVGDVVTLLMGPLIAWIGWNTWRRPDEIPYVASGGPRWTQRCWSVGFVLLGGTVTALGWFGLAGREEVWPVGLVRLIAAGLIVPPMMVAAVSRARKRRRSAGGPGLGSG
ncbi:hypothetical protein [Streptomyces sp. MA15]|uniref:hypothetical protein n=1 Tax=unclassified Streptomyces TaxID=2593676 RepID=UPI0025B238EF|nr:hypothetical protein [Streptomyces sp. MA15]MDN3271784.1 hypothetical protein [Streptomyces sp. MA15]